MLTCNLQFVIHDLYHKQDTVGCITKTDYTSVTKKVNRINRFSFIQTKTKMSAFMLELWIKLRQMKRTQEAHSKKYTDMKLKAINECVLVDRIGATHDSMSRNPFASNRCVCLWNANAKWKCMIPKNGICMSATHWNRNHQMEWNECIYIILYGVLNVTLAMKLLWTFILHSFFC